MLLQPDLKVNFTFLISILVFCTLLFGESTNDTVVTVTAKTQSYSGKYAPENCTMMWIQKPDKTFIKTIFRAAGTYISHCTVWRAISGGKLQSLDGLTGASRENHNDTLKATWDCTGRDNKPVPHGTYEFWIELTEDDHTGKTSFGSIEIDGNFKKVSGTTSPVFEVFEAEYHLRSTAIQKKVHQNTAVNNKVSVIFKNDILSIDLPYAEQFFVSLVSPAGRVVAKSKGSGKNAILQTSDFHMIRGVYIIRIAQSDRTYTLHQVLGF